MTTAVAEAVEEKTGNNLIVIKPSSVMSVFTDASQIDPILKQIADEARSFIPDVTTAKGRKEIASIAYKVAQTKTYLDGLGKDLVADMKELPKKVDANRKTVRDFLDSLRDEVRLPLTAWEAEQERIEAEKKAAEEAAALAIKVESDWEIALLMNQAFDRNVEDMRIKGEQERKEREDRIAAEAAEKARLDAEQKAAAEKAAAERREAEAKLAAEVAQRQQKEAEERAARIEKESAEREAKARQEAAEQERLRQDQAARAEREAAEARQKDRDLRVAVHNDALADFIATGLTEEQGKAVVSAIVKQQVRHVSITY